MQCKLYRDSLYNFWSILVKNKREFWIQKSREEIARERGYDSWYSYMEKEGPRWLQSGLRIHVMMLIVKVCPLKVYFTVHCRLYLEQYTETRERGEGFFFFSTLLVIENISWVILNEALQENTVTVRSGDLWILGLQITVACGPLSQTCPIYSSFYLIIKIFADSKHLGFRAKNINWMLNIREQSTILCKYCI